MSTPAANSYGGGGGYDAAGYDAGWSDPSQAWSDPAAWAEEVTPPPPPSAGSEVAPPEAPAVAPEPVEEPVYTKESYPDTYENDTSYAPQAAPVQQQSEEEYPAPAVDGCVFEISLPISVLICIIMTLFRTLMVGKICRAVYAYQAQNSDEIDMAEEEQLTVVSAVDRDWVTAQNAQGMSGSKCQTN